MQPISSEPPATPAQDHHEQCPEECILSARSPRHSLTELKAKLWAPFYRLLKLHIEILFDLDPAPTPRALTPSFGDNFLRLPPELRLMIWPLIFRDTQPGLEHRRPLIHPLIPRRETTFEALIKLHPLIREELTHWYFATQGMIFRSSSGLAHFASHVSDTPNILNLRCASLNLDTIHCFHPLTSPPTQPRFLRWLREIFLCPRKSEPEMNRERLQRLRLSETLKSFELREFTIRAEKWDLDDTADSRKLREIYLDLRDKAPPIGIAEGGKLVLELGLREPFTEFFVRAVCRKVDGVLRIGKPELAERK